MSYSTDRADSRSLTTIVAVLMGVALIVAILYFAVWAPSQTQGQPSTVIVQPPVAGPAGAPGATGNQGAPGATGNQGAQGAAGSQGADGAAGSQGADGAQGADGEKGTTGTTGG